MFKLKAQAVKSLFNDCTNEEKLEIVVPLCNSIEPTLFLNHDIGLLIFFFCYKKYLAKAKASYKSYEDLCNQSYFCE